jgi:hypothetical protein
MIWRDHRRAVGALSIIRGLVLHDLRASARSVNVVAISRRRCGATDLAAT